jgi:hypothetical protein
MPYEKQASNSGNDCQSQIMSSHDMQGEEDVVVAYRLV